MKSIHESVWIAPSAELYGRIEIGEGSSIWPQCVIRAECQEVRIGRHTNLQDFVMIHVGYDDPTRIGDFCSITHRAVVHGATVEDECLIGIGAVVMDGAVIGRGSIVAPGAVVTERTVIPPGSIVAGVPARVIKSRDSAEENRAERVELRVERAGLREGRASRVGGRGLSPLRGREDAGTRERVVAEVAPPLREPIPVGETLTECAFLYGRAFPHLLLAVAVFAFPLQLLSEYWLERRFGPAEIWRPLLLQLGLASIISPFLGAAAIIAADASAVGDTLSSGELLRRSARPWLRVLFAQQLSGALIALGVIAFLVPGVIAFARYALVEPVAVLERPSTVRCLDRSRELVKGATGRVLLLLALLELPGLAATSLGGLLTTANPALSGFAFTALTGSLASLAGMLTYVGMFVVYRTRSAG